jgi:hypothetical protein
MINLQGTEYEKDRGQRILRLVQAICWLIHKDEKQKILNESWYFK